MTRVLVQRTSSGSSSNLNRSSLPSSSSARVEEPHVNLKDGETGDEAAEQEHLDSGIIDGKLPQSDELLSGSELNDSRRDEVADCLKIGDVHVNPGTGAALRVSGTVDIDSRVFSGADSVDAGIGRSHPPPPPPPPVPPPKTPPNLNTRRLVSGGSNDVLIGPSRRGDAWPIVSTRTSPSRSRPSSPSSRSEEGYNSADEHNPCFVSSSYNDSERERQFEIDIRRAKGLEVKRMLEDGNCLFRAIADQVYGDPELYDLSRQMCIDYMERERDHFSQFVTQGFSSYCKRKRKDKVYGNNLEIQAFAEMYNRPILIHSYSSEPINIFHASYVTDLPPIRLSFHHGNHYNSLVDPRRITVGAGLGFSCLRGTNVIDNVQVKAAIKAQQDQQIDNALLAEGRFYSDLELTEKEIERMVMEASRSEFKQQNSRRESSTSSAEPSSSRTSKKVVMSSSMEVVLSMGFSYLQVMEAYSIFGEDVDSMVCYILETDTSSSNRRKGKATE